MMAGSRVAAPTTTTTEPPTTTTTTTEADRDLSFGLLDQVPFRWQVGLFIGFVVGAALLLRKATSYY